MRLPLKLSLLLEAASAGPLVVAAAATLPHNRAQLRRHLDALYAQSASALAEEVDRALLEKLDGLAQAAQPLDFKRFDDAQVQAALRLLYKQTRHANVVGLFDSAGEAVIEPVTIDHAETRMADREAVTEATLDLYARHVPLREALSGGAVIGPPYMVAPPMGTPTPRVVLAVRVAGRGSQPWVLAAEVSLRPLVQRFERFRIGERGRAFLVDVQNRVVAHPDPKLMATRADLSSHPVIARVADSDVLGATALVKHLLWTVAVEQPRDEALAPIDRQRNTTLLWMLVGLFAAATIGAFASFGITARVSRLIQAVEHVAEGKLDTEIKTRGRDELSRLGTAFNAMVKGLRERERLRRTLSRYVSDDIAARILKEQSDVDLKGEQVDVTVAFLDMRGFTSFSEHHSPMEVAQVLNSYFELIVKCVRQHGGVVNKFMGDAVMAIFGAPTTLPQSAFSAVEAALEIQRRIAIFNEERLRVGVPVFEFGIGVNTGPAVACNVGSAERMEYTVIGDAVNLAQRLQAHAAAGEVVVSNATLLRLEGRFRIQPLGEITMKSKEKPVPAFKILGPSAARPAVVQSS